MDKRDRSFSASCCRDGAVSCRAVLCRAMLRRPVLSVTPCYDVSCRALCIVQSCSLRNVVLSGRRFVVCAVLCTVSSELPWRLPWQLSWRKTFLLWLWVCVSPNSFQCCADTAPRSCATESSPEVEAHNHTVESFRCGVLA